ncbi:MAG: hypothetical protein M1150_01590 [Patescibacteria group bacterium]|nr:hypothetical protein [Patescibacteria group bacterium]
MNLNVTIGSIPLETPLLLASGYLTETPDFFLKSKKYGCAGMVTRSLKEFVPLARVRTPAPRYVVPNPDIMLNCEWGNEQPWTNWRDRWVQEVKATDSPIIISLSGREIASCQNLIHAFDELQVDAYEVNISCSHSGALNGNLNVDANHFRRLMGEIRNITTTPIWVKLSYSPVVVGMAIEAEKLGAEAIVCTNTIGPGLFLDIETTRPKLGIKGGAGGVSGKAIFPIALRCIYEISRAVRIPVVGVGGVGTAEDVLQMLMAGASAVEIYTEVALKGPVSFKKITHGLDEFLSRHPQYQSLSDVVGVSHRWAEEQSFEAPKPIIIADHCSGCKRCFYSCAFGALAFTKTNGRTVAVIKSNCNACNACVGVCPTESNAIKAVFNRGEHG